MTMLTTGGLRPSGLNGFTSDVYVVLESFVLSPWSLLKQACGFSIDPCHLDGDDLRALLPQLQSQVARVTDDDNAAALVAALAPFVEAPPPPSQTPVCFDY